MMKTAKASEADMAMAMELVSALELLGQRSYPCMHEASSDRQCDDELERFDRDDDAQCARALRHLLDVGQRGSLGRVVYGMAVLLDPRNKVVDPAADTLEHHPETVDAKRIAQEFASQQLTSSRP